MTLYYCISLCLLLMLFMATFKKREFAVANGARIYQRNRLDFHTVLFLLSMTFLWVLTAFRSGEIGNDTPVYIRYLSALIKGGANPNYDIEMGYQYYCILLSKINPSPHFLLIVTATICYAGTVLYIYLYSKNTLLSLVLFFAMFFSPFTNTLRQDIAMVICMYAYQAINKKKHIIALLLIVFASTFHISALITLLLFFKNFFAYDPALVLPISIVLAMLSVTGILNKLFSIVLVEYSGYFNSKWAESGWLGVAVEFIRALIFYFIVYKAYRKSVMKNSLMLCNFLLALLMSTFGFTVNLFTRVSEYFFIIGLVEIPNAIETGTFKNRKIWILLLGSLLLTYFIISLIYRPEWNHIYPYKFWSD